MFLNVFCLKANIYEQWPQEEGKNKREKIDTQKTLADVA